MDLPEAEREGALDDLRHRADVLGGHVHDLGEGEAGHVHHHHQAGDLRLWLPGHSLEAEVVGGEYVGRGDGVRVPDASPVLFEGEKII